MSGRPFWSDTFECDLPKVIPGARDAVGDLADVHLWTTGHTTHGALNHPDVWNSDAGMVAFFGFRSPARPEVYWTDRPMVRCTFWEALRDAWAHHILIAVEGGLVWNSGLLWPQYEALMAEVRGWPSADPAKAAAARASVRVSLCTAVARFRTLTQRDPNRVRRFETPAAASPGAHTPEHRT
ncbi:hypothetical protein [Methylobacterium haplocladii]|uniref:Uncharacterized protein n=1 Tax=Methylobacterium haplocladii TaxID=1176176 RepID=A0A512IS69_9HYPH|nr:hypothetical protein [Methylobacterium haplocladii]GEP00550.1 hypothetical protein MHA02_29370 [Methylobacterium haplocladii]GJD85463.1 hypothetical protein HPGCJGGD_3352 [Methylobacterium haplocladii]GLS57850.1 hypothetical protein GCM10007887_05060 [Methylobacterium haplocladii]